MKRRSTDEHDDISTNEVKAARTTLFQWVKMWITNLPVIAKAIALVVAAVTGTIAAPQVYQQVTELAGLEAPPPIPKGQITIPDPEAPIIGWRNGVNTSLSSQTAAINSNTASLGALRQEIRELEERLESQRNRGDADVSRAVRDNSARLEIIEKVVQP